MVLLVDLESVQKFDPSKLPSGLDIKVFHGEHQKKLPLKLVKQSQPLGDRLEWIEISGNGPNALDFHIACHLGKAWAEKSQAEYVVLSKDTGFDPLLKYLNTRNLICRRAPDYSSIVTNGKQTVGASAQSVRDVIKSIEKNKRPRKRTTLTNYLQTHFNKNLSAESFAKAIDQLIQAHMIEGTDGSLIYNF